MGSKVTISQPNLPPGEELHISGLGIFLNGESRVVTDEEEETWRGIHGVWKTEGEGDEAHEVRVPGPSLKDAFANDPTVKVVKATKAETAEAAEAAVAPPAEEAPAEGSE